VWHVSGDGPGGDAVRSASVGVPAKTGGITNDDGSPTRADQTALPQVGESPGDRLPRRTDEARQLVLGERKADPGLDHRRSRPARFIGRFDQDAGEPSCRGVGPELGATTIGITQAADEQAKQGQRRLGVGLEEGVQLASVDDQAAQRIEGYDARRSGAPWVERSHLADQVTRAPDAQGDLVSLRGHREDAGLSFEQEEDSVAAVAFQEQRGATSVVPLASQAGERPSFVWNQQVQEAAGRAKFRHRCSR
jgi:hypothetical protein